MPEKLNNNSTSLAQELENQEIADRVKSNQESIQELKEPMKKLLMEMHSSIESGEYNLIIGIDTSGRLPTIIFDRIIKHIYKKRGYKSPSIIFSPGRYLDIGRKNEIEKQLRALTNNTKKVLILDDIIALGTSMGKLTELLNRVGVKFDVATISLLDHSSIEEMRMKLNAPNLFTGETGPEENIRSVYNNRDMSGVSKSRFSGIKPFKEGEQVSEVGPRRVFYKSIFLATRKDAEALADELINWYESEYHKE